MLLKKMPNKNPNQNENKKQSQNLRHQTKNFFNVSQYRNQ